jgi:Pyruvate/2-oxoacid:ferredoxin oxidoreductase gamma subunit
MVFKKIIAILTLLCFALSVQGCYTRCQIKKEHLPNYPQYHIDKVVMLDDKFIEFENKKDKEAVFKENKIEGFTRDGVFKSIPLSQVKTIHLSKLDKRKTNSYILGAAVAAVAIAAFLSTDYLGVGGGGGGGGCSG